MYRTQRRRSCGRDTVYANVAIVNYAKNRTTAEEVPLVNLNLHRILAKSTLMDLQGDGEACMSEQRSQQA